MSTKMNVPLTDSCFWPIRLPFLKVVCPLHFDLQSDIRTSTELCFCRTVSVTWFDPMTPCSRNEYEMHIPFAVFSTERMRSAGYSTSGRQNRID